MAKYRKKPVVIEATQYNPIEGEHQFAAVSRIKKELGLPKDVTDTITCMHPGILHITTLEGVMAANAGDWIIKGVQGEIYPCKPDIFEATYEPAPL